MNFRNLKFLNLPIAETSVPHLSRASIIQYKLAEQLLSRAGDWVLNPQLFKSARCFTVAACFGCLCVGSKTFPQDLVEDSSLR